MPSGWKLLFYDNSLRTPYHRNYRLSIILRDLFCGGGSTLIELVCLLPGGNTVGFGWPRQI